MLMHTKHAYLDLAMGYSVLNIVSGAAMAVVWMRCACSPGQMRVSVPSALRWPSCGWLYQAQVCIKFSGLDCLDCIASHCLGVCFSLLCFDQLTCCTVATQVRHDKQLHKQ